MGDEYLSAVEAAQTLGVSRQTLYAYVTRKGIRSQPTPGSRLRRYWKADIDAIAAKGGSEARRKSAADRTTITLITDRELFYRGQNVVEIAEHATLEAVAALLWGVSENAVLGLPAPLGAPLLAKLARLLDNEPAVVRAFAMFPLLEDANPRAYDLSARGIAKTGTDIVRWYAAITLRSLEPAAEPLHLFVARRLALPAEQADLIRRLLVLAADHGFEPSTVMVRGMTGTGVTPWRSVLSGLAVGLGRRTRTHNYYAINRFIAEIISAPHPRKAVIERLKEGEVLPGFGSSFYAHGDPRARALLRFCGELFALEPAYRRLREVILTVREVCDLEPNFALACLFVGWRIGLHPLESLFHVGRTVGWIAHAIEQLEMGETGHELGAYNGPLPPIATDQYRRAASIVDDPRQS